MSGVDIGPRAEQIIREISGIDHTSPMIDHAAVERAVRLHFERLNIEPLPIRWVRDAEAGYSAARSAAESAAWSATRSAAWGAAWSAAWNAAWSAAWNAAWNAVERAARSAARSEAESVARSAAWSEAESAARSAAWNAARSAAWSAAWNAGGSAGGSAAESAAESAARSAARSAVERAAESAGLHAIGRPVPAMEKWIGIWLPFVNAYRAGLWLFWVTSTEVIVVPRPALRIENDRLHCATGPAVSWPNGARYYFWRGVRVPADWIDARDQLATETALTWQNVEQRRAAAEIVGWSRVIEKLKPIIVQRDPDPEIGTLLCVDLPDAPRSLFLQVRCGTGRSFCLPVPSEMKTARQANAWTYGLTETEYQPEART